jgi:predicted PurR-regulated permease PerM
MVLRQLCHWLGIGVALSLDFYIRGSGEESGAGAGLNALLLLALGCYLAGVHFDWLFAPVGVHLTLALIILTKADQYLWLLFVVGFVSVRCAARPDAVLVGGAGPATRGRPGGTVSAGRVVTPLPVASAHTRGETLSTSDHDTPSGMAAEARRPPSWLVVLKHLASWALCLAVLYVARDFFFTAFMTFLFSSMTLAVVGRGMQWLSPDRERPGLRRVLTVSVFMLVPLALLGVGCLVRPRLLAQGQQLAGWLSHVNPETAVTRLLEHPVGSLEFQAQYGSPGDPRYVQGLETFRASGVLHAEAYNDFPHLESWGLIALCNATLIGIALRVLGVEHEVLLSLAVFILCLVSTLGMMLAWILIVAMAVVQPGGGMILALKATAAVLVVILLETFVLGPHILGKMMELHPVLILTVLPLAQYFFGVWGLILATPREFGERLYCRPSQQSQHRLLWGHGQRTGRWWGAATL